ncbi:ABC transporter ATP-binding protein [Ensifer sp. NBAIM29]|nr:ABC transporter ATP-binding protein [Ensifer sp. NBAIM29]
MSKSDKQILLRLTGVSARYGEALAIENISLEAAAGAVVTIVGANGAGKTTSLKVASGVMKPASGDVYFDGQRVTGERTGNLVRRGIAHCPEGRGIFPYMSVVENLRVGAFTVTDGSVIEERLTYIWSLFPRLKERETQYAGTLSGGEQQMVAIGRALMTSPKLLFLDEPTIGLAPKIVQQVAELIRRIRDEGVSIVLVEQNAEMALDLADYAYVMEGGRVRLEGPAKELKTSSLVRDAYLGI